MYTLFLYVPCTEWWRKLLLLVRNLLVEQSLTKYIQPLHSTKRTCYLSNTLPHMHTYANTHYFSCQNRSGVDDTCGTHIAAAFSVHHLTALLFGTKGTELRCDWQNNTNTLYSTSVHLILHISGWFSSLTVRAAACHLLLWQDEVMIWHLTLFYPSGVKLFSRGVNGTQVQL